MSTEIVGRILRRAKELDLSHRAASLASGMGPDAIRDMIRKPGMSPTMETLGKLAGGLQTTPQWLAFGSDAAAEGDLLPQSDTAESSTATQIFDAQFVEALYGGTLQAGNWREVDDFEGQDRESQVVPRDRQYPRDPHIIYDVAGDSMNAANPPMPPGCKVLAIATDNPSRPIPIRTGDLVVIQRKQAQGGLIERSVKEIEMGDEETRFLPRSTNPKHKPIVVRNDPNEEDEGVEVIGLVIEVMSNARRR